MDICDIKKLIIILKQEAHERWVKNMEQRKLALVLASCSTFLLSFWNYNSKLEREQVLIIFQGSSPNTWRRYDRSINDIELIVDRRSVRAHTTRHSNDVAGAVSVWCNFVCRSSARQLTFFFIYSFDSPATSPLLCCAPNNKPLTKPGWPGSFCDYTRALLWEYEARRMK